MSEGLITLAALFRGINVGGRTVLPMKELVAQLEALGLDGVKTYVQSGNAVFRCREEDRSGLAERIGREVRRRRGFEPAVLLLDLEQLRRTVQDNPFPEGEAEPKSLHANFLFSRPPAPDLEGMERLRRDSERFVLRDRVLYLHAPDGIGRSKLAAAAERRLGVPVTGRNWRSVTKILAMAQDAERSR
jgi:uncharacterized protein (DUF1697 family)